MNICFINTSSDKKLFRENRRNKVLIALISQLKRFGRWSVKTSEEVTALDYKIKSINTQNKTRIKDVSCARNP